MKKFNFKFDRVLKVRKMKEDETLRTLSSAQGVYQEELNKKKYLLSELQKSLGRREALGAEPVDIVLFHSEQDYIDGTKSRIIAAEQALYRANKMVERAMRDYFIARKKRKMIEVLYDKSLQLFRKEEARREQREMDDLTVMRFHLKEDGVEEFKGNGGGQKE